MIWDFETFRKVIADCLEALGETTAARAAGDTEFEGDIAATLDKSYQGMQMNLEGFTDEELGEAVEDTEPDLYDLFFHLPTSNKNKASMFARLVMEDERWIGLFASKEKTDAKND